MNIKIKKTFSIKKIDEKIRLIKKIEKKNLIKNK